MWLTLRTLSLQGLTKQQCAQNISDTIHFLDNFGFMVYDKKTVLIPMKEIIFVSFVLNSADMTVRLPFEKKEFTLKLCLSRNKRSHITIRKLSRLIGKIVATEPGAEYAQLRYKLLERIKENTY